MNKTVALLFAFPGLSLLVLAAAEQSIELSSLVQLWSIIFVLVLLNGFFVAAEFAIIGIRSTQLEPLAEQGSGAAKRVLQVLSSPANQDKYIATAQLGIALASLGLGMYGEPQIAYLVEPYLERWLGGEPDVALIHSLGYLISLSILTYLHVVIGEMVPKSIALSKPIRAVTAVSHPMSLFQTLFALPVHALNGLGNGLLKLLRVPPAQGHDRLHSPEEIRLIVEASTERGLLNLQEEEMIFNIFDFGDRHVGQVMTPRPKVKAISADVPYDELKRFVTTSQHSRFPVYEDDLDHIIGVLHLKDLVHYDLYGSGEFRLREMVRVAPFVPEAMSVSELLSDFRQKRIHMAIVLDEFGGLAGIVTLEDLVEEVVGEVRDEFDQEKEPFVEVEPGMLEVAGNILVEDLYAYGLELGSRDDLPEVETVGGLIVTWLGRPPQVGDKTSYHQIEFVVLEVEGLAVARAKIVFPVKSLEDDQESKKR